VNMDQPWNPAVLEQRIGRVHRLGQARPVRVFNFVAQGTIEHGMLNVIKFKKSVFAGVLDGGEDEVFLGGTRLTKFMETVEEATNDIPAAMPSVEEEVVGTAQGQMSVMEQVLAAGDEIVPDETTLAEERTRKEAGASRDDAWGELISTGLSFFEKLGQALGTSPAANQARVAAPPLAALMARDTATGEEYLKIPLPSADVLNTFAQALGGLAEALRAKETR